MVISTSFAIFDRRDSYLHFLQTEGRTKRGGDRKVETVLMFRMEGLMVRDRQTGRIMRWKASLLL